MRLPKIKIYKKVTKDGRTLIIELGDWWEIRATREFIRGINYLRDGGSEITTEPKDRFRLTKLLKSGDLIPLWYGYAFYDFGTDSVACMPIPLNWIRAGWELFKIRVLWPIRVAPNNLYKRNDIYSAGYIAGWNDRNKEV